MAEPGDLSRAAQPGCVGLPGGCPLRRARWTLRTALSEPTLACWGPQGEGWGPVLGGASTSLLQITGPGVLITALQRSLLPGHGATFLRGREDWSPGWHRAEPKAHPG